MSPPPMQSRLNTSLPKLLASLALILSPAATGALSLTSWRSAAVTAGAATLAIGAFCVAPRHAQLRRAALAAVVSFLGLAAMDVLSRPLLAGLLYQRSFERFAHVWPRMPLVSRFDAGVRYRGVAYGDLASISAGEVTRQSRDDRFVTDRFGFRNELGSEYKEDRPLDAILLGDSIGLGVSTTQDLTWHHLLTTLYGWNIYNLSMVGGPWSEFTDLSIEISRLRVKPAGTVVLWAISSANDLDDACLPMLHTDQLPWKNPPEEWMIAARTFRARSPVRQLLGRIDRMRTAQPDNVVKASLPDGRDVLFFAPFVRRRNRTVEEVLRHPNYGCLAATITAMRELARTKHLRVVVLLVPSKEEVYSWVLEHSPPRPRSEPSGFSIALEHLCRFNGMQFLDLGAIFSEESARVFRQSGELLWWLDDTHWSPRGHAFAASIVQTRILAPPVSGKGCASPK